MDALFGLPRKKSSGTSCRDALHGEAMFLNQSDIDEFAATMALPKIKASGVIDFNVHTTKVTFGICRLTAVISKQEML